MMNMDGVTTAFLISKVDAMPKLSIVRSTPRLRLDLGSSMPMEGSKTAI
jgi:hypothetical protein